MTPVAADQRWSLDFVSDQLTDGRRFRILAVVDDCTRECLALIADTSISGRRVARELDDASGLRQCPQRRDRPGRCASLGLRAPASCHPGNRRLKLTPDSRSDWMKNGGHVNNAPSAPPLYPNRT